MAWVIVPGYGIWPSKSYLPRRSRIIGQASQDFLGAHTRTEMSGEPTFTVADERPPIRWPNMSPEGLDAHRRFAVAFGADPNKRHGFDALLELVEEDERAFKNPTPKQAQDQAEKMAETVRELSRKGVAHEVDWLTLTSPEIRNGKPTVVIGVNPAVVVGRSRSGVPLVNVRGKPLPVAPSKIHGRPVEFRVTIAVPHAGAGTTEIAPLGEAPPRVEAARGKLLRMLGIDGGKRQPWHIGDGISTVGLQQWAAVRDSGRKARLKDFKDDRSAIEVLVLDDEKWDDVARRIPRSVDGVPVFVVRSGPIRLLSDVEGRANDDSTVVSNNWTGTRGGWYDFSGPDMAPGGADDMADIIRLDTDVGGARLSTLLIDKMPAHCGTYLRHRDNSWSFFLDPLLRVRLLLRGVKTPVSVPADKLVCWNTIPTEPLVGGFTHPETGFHCRSASIPSEWDTKTHGTPAVYLTGANGGIPNMDDAGAPPTALQRAEFLAKQINDRIGAGTKSQAPWWLYTLPLVKDGKPVVKVGVKGDYQPDAKELKALPWTQWVALGVEIDMEFVPPVGSSVKGTVAKITPEGLAEVGMADDDMGSAPIDSVWPTNSPNYREPTGPATGDFDQAMGEFSYSDFPCPKCGAPAQGATRCIPGEYFCANGHSWSRTNAKMFDGKTFEEKAGSMSDQRCGSGVTLSDLAQSSHGFPARWRYPSKFAQPPMVDPARAAGIRPRPSPFAEDTGMGSAPIVAMPTGMLNWDRVSGYEGQPWVTKDWSGQGFLSGKEETVFDDTFMGDMSDAPGAAPAVQSPGLGRTLGFGAAAAAVGAVTGWALAPGGDSRRGAVALGIGGGIAGLIVGKMFGGVQGMMETLAARPATGPVKA